MGVLEEKRRIERLVADADHKEYYGQDWYQINDEEIQVFMLYIESMPQVSCVYSLYECVIGVMQSDVSKARLESLRLQLPWLSYREPSIEEFQRFALLFGVSRYESHAFITKYHYWLARMGNTIQRDVQGLPLERNAPPWHKGRYLGCK